MFYFKANKNNIGSSKKRKNGSRYFQYTPPYKRLICFYVTIGRNFECFQYFNFETDFLNNENLFQKTGVAFFS